jgi:hypothetical protein
MDIATAAKQITIHVLLDRINDASQASNAAISTLGQAILDLGPHVMQINVEQIQDNLDAVLLIDRFGSTALFSRHRKPRS